MAAHLVFAPLPVVVSWVLLGSIVVGALWAIRTWFVKPLGGRITLVQIARWLETRHPEIQERVSTALELSSDSRGGVSEALLKELVVEAQGDVKEVDPTTEVRARRAKRWLWPASGLAAVFILVFVIFPGEAQRLLVRAVAPFSDLGNAGAVRFTIDPEDIEVLEGDEVKITVKYSDSEAEELSLIMEREGEETLSETLKRAGVEDGVSRFEYRLPAAKDSFHYFAQVGKSQSDGYDVTVASLPRIGKVKVVVDFPEYTDQSRQERPLEGGVSALGGSTITVKGTTTTGVERGRFLLDGREVGTVSLGPGADGTRVSINWTLEPEKGGLGQVMLHHELGREIEGLRFPVKVEQDVAPKVVLLAPTQAELRLRPDEQVRLEYEVLEDFGVNAAAVELLVNGSTVDPLPAAVPEQDALSARPIWRGEELVSLGALTEKYKNADELRMAVVVTDNLPESLGGPNVGRSEWLIIKIDRNAESLARQEIRAQQSDVRETIAEAIKEVREA
ncbi:MAG: hypothetical protein VYC95_01995, partial [Verrucomicrobiota bacterium]|nr:hypothetical protein [Verrucomicrobiota bacterium]